MFLPRMADCQGEILENTRAVIHTFNNTVCRPENCILNYLYTHKQKKEDGKATVYCCKLPAHEVIATFMQSICHYLTDGTGDLLLWHLKHKRTDTAVQPLLCSGRTASILPSDDGGRSAVQKPCTGTLHESKRHTGACRPVQLQGSHLPPHLQGRVRDGSLSIADQKRAEHISTASLFPISLSMTSWKSSLHFPQQFHRFCKTDLGDSPRTCRKSMHNNDEFMISFGNMPQP